MQLLSEDDLNLRDMTDEELAAAWELWFELAQSTNDDDPPYTHGVFQAVSKQPERVSGSRVNRDVGASSLPLIERSPS